MTSRCALPILADSAPGKRSLAFRTRDARSRARSRRVLAKVAGSAHSGARPCSIVIQRTIRARQLRILGGVLARSTHSAGSGTDSHTGFAGRTRGALSIGSQCLEVARRAVGARRSPRDVLARIAIGASSGPRGTDLAWRAWKTRRGRLIRARGTRSARTSGALGNDIACRACSTRRSRGSAVPRRTHIAV